MKLNGAVYHICSAEDMHAQEIQETTAFLQLYKRRECAKSFASFLHDPDELVRINAIKFLGEIKAKAVRKELEDLLTDENWRVRFFAAQALGFIGSEKSINSLKVLILGEQKEQVVLEGVQALARIDTILSRVALRELFAHSRIFVKDVAAVTLYALSEREVYASYLRSILDYDRKKKIKASILLYYQDNEKMRRFLTEIA